MVKAKQARVRKPTLDDKAFGFEPDFTGRVIGRTAFKRALDYFNYHKDTKWSRRQAMKWLKQAHPTIHKRAVNIPEFQFATVYGVIATINMQGGSIQDETMTDWMLDRMKTLQVREKAVEEVATVRLKKDPATALKEKTSRIISFLEEVVDNLDVDFDPYDSLQVNNAAARTASAIIDYYQPQLDELKLVKGDKELKAAFSNVDVPKTIKVLTSIIESAQRVGNLKQASRKVRVPKKAKPIDLTKFKYRTEDKVLALVSINPQSVVGKSVLFLYNTKWSQLTVLVADGTFQIKGQTVQNVNEDKSFMKRVGVRKIDKVREIRDSTRVRSQKLFKAINVGEQSAKTRIGPDTIILKAF